jgi:hypothetical protein
MGTTQGNSMCSYFYLKLVRRPVSHFIFIFCFFFHKIAEQEGRTGLEAGDAVGTGGKGQEVEKGVGG